MAAATTCRGGRWRGGRGDRRQTSRPPAHGGWETALDAVWATPFRLAVPGHGAPMTRGQFDTYRGACARFRARVGSERTAAACAGGWTEDVSSLPDGEADRRQATEYAAYYVGFLRKNAGASPDCRVK